ncbi:cell wall metabolism sensor histidine kinase WalK [Aerococcaceae bacterium DSM 111176]|nr:cell wall metabolism sensor histidine kinase WalK [Aerococcaceae bacterium DSM 111176]
MKRKSYHFFQSIYFKIPLLFLFILMIAFQFIGVFFINQLESQSVENFKNQINVQGEFLTSNLAPIMSNVNLDNEEQALRMNQALDTFATTNVTRIWVVNPNETIIATNQDINQSQIGTQANSNVTRNVLLTQNAYASEVRDPSVDNPHYLLITPIVSEQQNQSLGVVIIEAGMADIYSLNNEIVEVFVTSAILAIAVSLVVSFFMSQGLTRPIENMRQQAIRISEGVYNYPAEVFGQDELGELAITINELADKVREAQESTESERQRLDGVLRHMRDGVISTDRRGNVVLVNDRALYLLNVRQDWSLGRSILDLLDIRDDFYIDDLIRADTEVTVTREIKNVTTILRAEFSVIRRETGFVTGLVCVLTDVTEQEKTDQERRDFVSNVSHELRTPLTSVKSYSEALLDGAWQDEAIAPQFLQVIQSESNRMMRMITNLLDLSKMDSDQIILNIEFIDLKRVVDHIVDRLEFTQKESDFKHTIIREYTPNEVFVEIDQDRMIQVIDNLLNNAIKYSPDGGTIKIKIVDSHDKVYISVSDEGLGISKADAEHLFERFYRVDKARSREQGGSGLGLAISKEVVEMHDGRIWVDSVEQEGSTFTIELPLAEFDEFDDWGDES